MKSSLLPLCFLLLISWSSHSDLCEAVWSTLTLQSSWLQYGFHVDRDILFFRFLDASLIEFLNEQHISIRNIDGCYFLTAEEQTFLMLKLKLVRFALTTTSTQHSHAVCAARNAQQACSHSYLGTYYISMQTFWHTPPHAGCFSECGLDFLKISQSCIPQLINLNSGISLCSCALPMRSDLVWWLINSCSPFIPDKAVTKCQSCQQLFVYS